MKNHLFYIFHKNRNIIIISLSLVVLLFVGYKLLFAKKTSLVTKESNPEYYKDYSLSKIIERGDKLEILGLKAEENYTVAELAKVRRTQNYAQNNTIHELKFGTVIYTKVIDSSSSIKADPKLIERENKKGFVAVYAEKPTRINDLPVGYLSEEEFVSKEKFKDYKPEIKEEEIVKYSISILDAVESNADFDGSIYTLSENAKRSKEVLSFGDYNNDGLKDMIAIVDNPNNSSSGLLVFFKSNDGGYDLTYKKAFNSKINVKTIKKETPITLKVESTIFPYDGFFINEKNGNSYFHIFDSDTKDFMVILKEKPVPVVILPKKELIPAENKAEKPVEKIDDKKETKPVVKTPEKKATKTDEKKVEKKKDKSKP